MRLMTSHVRFFLPPINDKGVLHVGLQRVSPVSALGGVLSRAHSQLIEPPTPLKPLKPLELIMYLRSITSVAAAIALLSGCAATIDQAGLEQRTAQAIGRSVGQFNISDRTEETGGRINYTVTTRDKEVYRCYLYGATSFQKAMSFGQTPHSDAICTAMVGGHKGSSPSSPSGRQAGEPCNALMRTAGRC